MPNHRGLDTDIGWQKREFRKVWKAIRESNAAKRLQAATIGAGGLTIKDGGSLVSRYPDSVGGGIATTFGPLAEDPDMGWGLRVMDEGGGDVFIAYRVYPTVDAPAGLNQLNIKATTLIDSGQGAQIFLTTDIILGGGSTRIEHTTTGSAANTVIDPVTGQIQRSTSSLRYKQDVEDAEVDPAAVLNMQPRTWRDKAEVKNDPDTETRHVGFIAEELHDLGLGQFVTYDADGDPEAISYDRLSVALLAVLKDQEKRIAALESAREA